MNEDGGNLNNISEKELIEKARTDEAAFGVLYEKSYDPIFGYLLRRCGDQHLAQDLTSETFLKAVKAFPKYCYQPGKPFVAWLYTIASNELKMYYRKQKRYEFRELELFSNLKRFSVGQSHTFENDEIFDTYKIVQKAMKQLPDIDQKIISLRYFEKKSYAEISQIIDKSEVTLRTRQSRAIKKLRKLLEKDGNGDII